MLIPEPDLTLFLSRSVESLLEGLTEPRRHLPIDRTVLISRTIDRWSIHGLGLLGQKPILENSALVAAHTRGRSATIHDRHMVIGSRVPHTASSIMS